MKFAILLLAAASVYAATTWNNYLTDHCTSQAQSHRDNPHAKTGITRCNDNSVSFVQPDSRGWEGRCGHTMAANMLYAICGKVGHPVETFGPYMNDIGSGTKHTTVTSGLNVVFGQHKTICPQRPQASWWYIKLGNAQNFITSVQKYLTPTYSTKNMNTITRNGKTYYRNPVGSMINNPDGGLHWVTIVDSYQQNGVCQFVVNHWDNQYTIPCTKLAEYASKVRSMFPFVMPNYTVVVFR